MTTSAIKQRADLTFKHNLSHTRYGWLRLTPAYSVKLVMKILERYPEAQSVFDPFSGTATTTLCAAMAGCNALSIDINPFLVWLGQTKTAVYSNTIISQTEEIAEQIHRKTERKELPPALPPSIFNIHRWWDSSQLDYLCRLKAGINTYGTEETRDLLLVGFCRTVIELSNAAFNHQSMSFKKTKPQIAQLELWTEDPLCGSLFFNHVKEALRSAADNPSGTACVMYSDARKMEGLHGKEFDLLITSPPYPNRISYIRELRPYMYWLGYLKEAREAGEIDWQAIGGTWGIATSRLNNWVRSKDVFFPDYLHDILKNIASADNKSGPVLSNYVGKYFEDMWIHFKSVKGVMRYNANLHYIIGNSKFYDFVVPAEKIYADMLKEAGFMNINIETLRKRNSKKELLEFDVSAQT
jgi:DNA modification methylase